MLAGSHTSDAQSSRPAHPRPSMHFGLPAPPQSTSVSAPFFTPSVFVGAWHTLSVHTPLAQSAAAAHFFESSHFLQVAPPQSTSVSSWFAVLSSHFAGWHVPAAEQILLSQSAGFVHSLPGPLPPSLV